MTDHGETPLEGPARDRLDDLIGPYFTRKRVAEWLHASEEHVDDLAARGDLVAVPDATGGSRYPAFQFERYERTLPHVAWNLRFIDPEGIDPWGTALWLNTASATFGSLTAAEVLPRGNCHLVLDAARHGYEKRGQA